MAVTIAKCIEELDSCWPACYGKNEGGWDLFFASDNANPVIVRVFHHKTLAIEGEVVERSSAITSVSFKQRKVDDSV